MSNIEQKVSQARTEISDFEADFRRSVEITRSRLASRFVGFYFLSLSGAFLGAASYNILIRANHFVDLQPIDVKEFLTVISGLIGPSLGFVIGYYFQSTKEK